jgi:predicted signal transduction protein with EAL and GGDEF domain
MPSSAPTPAQLLTLEITEGTLMADPERARAVLRALRELGVRVAIDDYGTGYSSLAYLKNLAVDELKIDRAFVAGMATDRADMHIVRSTIDLAHNLELEVVAEGVEDEVTWSHLRELGCDTIQGFYLSRPAPAEQLAPWIHKRPRPPRPSPRHDPSGAESSHTRAFTPPDLGLHRRHPQRPGRPPEVAAASLVAPGTCTVPHRSVRAT